MIVLKPDDVLKTIEKNFGDARLYRYGIRVSGTEKSVEITGIVDSLDTLGELRELFVEHEIKVKTQEETVESKVERAIVKIPVSDVRKDPRFRSERIHQLIFGETVKILGFEGEHVFVKDLRTGYLGWMRASHLLFTNRKGIDEWKESGTEVIVDKRFSKAVCGTEEFHVPFGTRIYASAEKERWVSRMPDGTETTIPLKDASPTSSIGFETVKNVWDLFLGTPYLWGGSSSYGYDCSGYVGRLYGYAGVKIPRDADLQRDFTKTIEEKELRFGDLVFFPGHVGMFIGEGKMVHSNLTYGGVSISNLLMPENAYEKSLKSTVTKFGRAV